jgi:hypothetical protein
MHMRDAFEVVSAAVIRHLSHRSGATTEHANADAGAGGLQSMLGAGTSGGGRLDPLSSVAASSLAQSDIMSRSPAPGPGMGPAPGTGTGTGALESLFPADFSGTNASTNINANANSNAGAMPMPMPMPWSDWAIDPSRPPSPSPLADPSLATLDAFLFNPFGAVSSDDLLSLQAGFGEYAFEQM